MNRTGARSAGGPRRVLVAGIGSSHRRDDGAGPAVVAELVRLRSALGPGPDVEVVLDPLGLLGRWDGATLAVVVDAIRSGARAGTVQVVELEGARSTGEGPWSGGTSTHGIGLVGALRLARAVGSGPARVVAVGLEGADFGPGEELSPEVAAAVPKAAARVISLIEEAG